MRTPRSLAFVAIALTLGGLACLRLVHAEESDKAAMPAPQRAISQPFLDSLVGSWATESIVIHDGKEGSGTGTSTWTRGVGGTAMLQNYEGTMPGPDGKPMNFHGHGVYKISDDGKTATLWWFCNMSPDVMKLSGTIDDKAIRLSGDSPKGGRTLVSFEKTPEGLAFKMSEGKNELSETYRRAP